MQWPMLGDNAHVKLQRERKSRGGKIVSDIFVLCHYPTFPLLSNSYGHLTSLLARFAPAGFITLWADYYLES